MRLLLVEDDTMIGEAVHDLLRAEHYAVDWARDVLMERGIDPSAHPVRALRALRRADRRLSLVSARYLADATAGRPQRRSRARSPMLE